MQDLVRSSKPQVGIKSENLMEYPAYPGIFHATHRDYSAPEPPGCHGEGRQIGGFEPLNPELNSSKESSYTLGPWVTVHLRGKAYARS